MPPGLEGLVMQLGGIRGVEWVIVLGLIVAVFFGAKKIPELARSLGKATAEFEKARIEARRELEQMKSSGNAGREKLEKVADLLGIDHVDRSDDDLRAAIEAELSNTKK